MTTLLPGLRMTRMRASICVAASAASLTFAAVAYADSVVWFDGYLNSGRWTSPYRNSLNEVSVRKTTSLSGEACTNARNTDFSLATTDKCVSQYDAVAVQPLCGCQLRYPTVSVRNNGSNNISMKGRRSY